MTDLQRKQLEQHIRDAKDPKAVREFIETFNDPVKAIEAIEEHRYPPWNTPGIAAHQYTHTYPDDFYTIGTIAPHDIWKQIDIAEVKDNIPDTNPVWDYPLPDEFHRGMGYHYYEWFLIIIEVEQEHGHQAKKKNYEMTVSPSEELCTINAGFQLKDREKLDRDLFVPGERVGFVKEPTSQGYDLWLIHNPSQASLNEIEEVHQWWLNA